jgi:DNA-binding SARP family transcriptional activator
MISSAAAAAPEPGDDKPSRVLRLLGVPCLVLPAAPDDGSADGLASAPPEPRQVDLARKDAALLALLAIDGPQAPQRLWALLWPESTSGQAGNNLRRRATELKRDAGGQLFLLGSPVRLAPDLAVDVSHIDAFDDDALCAAGGLLDGVDVGDLADLDRWLAEARRRVNDRIAERLARRAEAAEAAGELPRAIVLVEHLIERRPLDERAWQQLVSLHYLNGNRGLALDTYWRFNQRLREELGTPPGLEMQRLMQSVEAAEALPGRAAQALPVTLQRPPVLVGREAAWAAMDAAWQRQQAFLLVAHAGMGKSRLLEEFVRGRAQVHLERAQPGEAGIPYALLGRLLVELDRLFQPVLTPMQRQDLARLRPEFGAAPATPAHAPVLWQATEAVLAGAQARGLGALVLDDLHNADTASLEALRWLGSSRRLGTLCLGLATRPGWAADSPLSAWLEDSQRPLRIDLRPLDAAELTQLLATLALPSLVDAGLGERLFRMAGGHPLYTLATLRAALGAGRDLKAPQWPRPQGIEELLDARLRGLRPEARELVQVAAVAGADFSAELASHVLGRTVLALSACWAELDAADVFNGRSFSHDLMRDAALRALPLGVAQALHRRIAAWLEREPHPTPARVAAHWEAGERHAEAGLWWHRAGEAAHASGRLDEQVAMFERAAACHAQAGHIEARFESSFARLPALRLRHGGGAVLEALPAVEAVADTRAQRLRCTLLRAEALLDVERSREALAVTRAAVQEAPLHRTLHADAQALHAYALAQCGDDPGARAAAEAALQAAEAVSDGRQRLRALNAMRFVHYAADRIGDAMHWLKRAIVQAESLGERAEAATAEGNVAALLAVVGDVPATYTHATACRARHAEIGLAEHSTMGIVNHIVLGAAASALGRFDEALDALHTAVAQSGALAAAGAQAKARLTLANLWLRLGRPDLASAETESLPPDYLPALRMQAELVRAHAAMQVGASSSRHLQALGRIAEQHPAPSLVQSGWFEWSWIEGDPRPVIARLAEVRARFEALGLHGTAQSLRWRELVRWLELDGQAATASAHAHAKALEPAAVAGTSAKCHPPQTLATLVEAFRRAGDEAAAARCQAAAFRWLDEAWPRVPEPHRASFTQALPLHRAWAARRAP